MENAIGDNDKTLGSELCGGGAEDFLGEGCGVEIVWIVDKVGTEVAGGFFDVAALG